MYKCKECGRIFEEPNIVHTTYEAYYGMYSEFDSHTTLYLEKCPSCGSEEISRYEYEEEEEEE